MGRHVVSINCSEDMTLNRMNQYLTGMTQSGSWALFDDTDRMTKGGYLDNGISRYTHKHIHIYIYTPVNDTFWLILAPGHCSTTLIA